MVKLDHLTLPVSEPARSRDWYLAHLELKVEFEVPERATVALQDDSGFTLFLVASPAGSFTASCTLAFQVDDVESTHRALAAQGVVFEKSPQKLYWGYGAELRDPDGYLIYLWDERSMAARG
jgi:catechol 2,3-dioxygenase-like lactoylglutathione lyase family enzyme